MKSDTPARDHLPSDRIQVMNPDVIFYVGPLCVPDFYTIRCVGSITAYSSLQAPLRFRRIGAEWEEVDCVVVPPYVPHQVSISAGYQATLLIEPETIVVDDLPLLAPGASGELARANLAGKIRAAYAALSSGTAGTNLPADLGQMFFDPPLPTRALDPRIQAIVDKIKQHPSSEITARQCAHDAGLSVCRFTHLFKAQTGTTFRRFRAWKRARNVLEQLRDPSTLTYIALDSGYPDLTHFSHSMRQIFGLTPTYMHTGAQRITYVGNSAPPSGRNGRRGRRPR